MIFRHSALGLLVGGSGAGLLLIARQNIGKGLDNFKQQ